MMQSLHIITTSTSLLGTSGTRIAREGFSPEMPSACGLRPCMKDAS